MTQETKNKINFQLKDNGFLIIAVSLIPVVVAFFYGCQSTVKSVRYPDQRVNRPQLENEIQNYLNEAQNRFDELDQHERIKNLLLEQAFTIAETGTVNPVALLTTFGSLLGMGAIADNVRKRKVIRDNLTTYVENVKNANKTT